jgi:inorganic triphosphatase YgiF
MRGRAPGKGLDRFACIGRRNAALAVAPIFETQFIRLFRQVVADAALNIFQF